MTPPMSNGKPENGLTSTTDSGKLNGNDGSSDHPTSPLVRSNGDLNVDSTSLCSDANDDVTTPTTSMQDCQLEQQQPTTTIHGVQVRCLGSVTLLISVYRAKNGPTRPF